MAPPNRRERILRTAYRLYARHGVAHVRMADIARASKVENALLRYHFPTSDALQREIFEHVIDERLQFIQARMRQAGGDPLDVLEAYVNGYDEWVIKDPENVALYLYFQYLATLQPEYREAHEVRRRSAHERIAFLIYRAMESGHIPRPDGASVDVLSEQIYAVIVGNTFNVLTGRPRDSRKTPSTRTWDLVRTLLRVDARKVSKT